MQPYTKLLLGNCLKQMAQLSDNSVDSIVTDPPYGLSFMGKKWDYDVPSVDIWIECLRVLKPGGHLLAFAGTRTQHRMAVNIEDAGFEIRDMIAWVYGSGFPKSLDVSKAIDKSAGAEREVVGKRNTFTGRNKESNTFMASPRIMDVTAPATDAARQWEGWGTALKPALEPITVARKPIKGTVADNVLKWGTGGLNIDECRVGLSGGTSRGEQGEREKDEKQGFRKNRIINEIGKGRFPANLIHDGSEEVERLFPNTSSGKMGPWNNRTTDGSPNGIYHKFNVEHPLGETYGDSGSAARFFYCAKASKSDRDEGCDDIKAKYVGTYAQDEWSRQNMGNTPDAVRQPRRNYHPTVKPTDLMRYLVKLVTPPNGIVLDPFMGSGSTGKACVSERFSFIGIEMEQKYMDIAKARIERQKQKGIQKDLF